MSFKKYTSIDNCDRKLTMDKYVVRGYAQQPWVVTLKVHGSNFSVYITENEMKCTKRSGWIKEGENFFNYQKVVARYDEKLKNVRKIVHEHFELSPEVPVQVFGEIFGGCYPHDEVEKVQGVKKVQKGVWYCPDVDFFPFDIYVRGQEFGGKDFPLDHDLFERIMKGAGFTLYAKSLFTGSFKECLEYPNEYPDPVHRYYGLPEIEGNICEGNVLKPVKATVEPCGSRVILKNKNDKFTERTKRTKKERKPINISPEAQKVIGIADEYINENRLRNVLSHFGEVTHKDFGKIMGAFAQDVRKDMEEDDPEVFSLEKEEQSRVNKVINSSCSVFIRQHFLNIIDGVF